MQQQFLFLTKAAILKEPQLDIFISTVILQTLVPRFLSLAPENELESTLRLASIQEFLFETSNID